MQDVAGGVDEGAKLLRQNAVDLLGQLPAGRAARIMVTLPSEAATDPGLARGLIEAGMNDRPDQLRARRRRGVASDGGQRSRGGT